MSESQIQKDIKFLMSFLPATSEEEVEPGLSPFFYITASYEGDVKIMQEVTNIKNRYGIVSQDATEEEEDYNE